MGNVGYGILVFPGVFLDVADGLLGFATFILEIPQAYDGSGHEPDTSSDADGFSAFFGVALNGRTAVRNTAISAPDGSCVSGLC